MPQHKQMTTTAVGRILVAIGNALLEESPKSASEPVEAVFRLKRPRGLDVHALSVKRVRREPSAPPVDSEAPVESHAEAVEMHTEAVESQAEAVERHTETVESLAAAVEYHTRLDTRKLSNHTRQLSNHTRQLSNHRRKLSHTRKHRERRRKSSAKCQSNCARKHRRPRQDRRREPSECQWKMPLTGMRSLSHARSPKLRLRPRCLKWHVKNTGLLRRGCTLAGASRPRCRAQMADPFGYSSMASQEDSRGS